MKWEVWSFPVLALSALGLAVAAGLQAAQAMSAAPAGSFLYQEHQTGTVAPQYFHSDKLVVDASGHWRAWRDFPFTQPAHETALASGTLEPSQMRALQMLAQEVPASGQPAFVDLPSHVGQMNPGAGKRVLGIRLPDGTFHKVEAFGGAPPSFQRLDAAVASATVDNPNQAGSDPVKRVP